MSTYTQSAVGSLPELLGRRWRIDPNRSKLQFRVPTLWGLATVTGHFTRYDGSLDLERSRAIQLNIDATSLDTGNGLRDRHLRSKDFFDVESQPVVTFESEEVKLDGERLLVTGTLAAAGSTVPLELGVDIRPVDDEIELVTAGTVDHRQVGMTHGLLGMIPTPTEVRVRARLVMEDR